MAKPCACDYLTGVACAVLWDAMDRNCHFGARGGVLVEVVWDGLPEWVRVPYMKACLPCVVVFPSSSGLVESAVNLPGPPGKPKYLV